MPLINRREAPQIFGSLSSVFLKKVGDLIKKESPKPYISKAWRFRECIITLLGVGGTSIWFAFSISSFVGGFISFIGYSIPNLSYSGIPIL